MSFSICVLTCHDYVEQHQRCLTSILRQAKAEPDAVSEIRIGVNRGTERCIDSCRALCRDFYNIGIRALWFICDTDFKYPTMRRMFHTGPPVIAEHVMWFDDDSYLTGQVGWFAAVAAAARTADVVGQPWKLKLRGNRWNFITNQPWFNPTVGRPDKDTITFMQGAWWVCRYDTLVKYDWPTPALRHCGGDSLFGELARHQHLRLEKFDQGVRINADEAGNHSKAKRRGHTEPELGTHYDPREPQDYTHHNFTAEIGGPI